MESIDYYRKRITAAYLATFPSTLTSMSAMRATELDFLSTLFTLEFCRTSRFLTDCLTLKDALRRPEGDRPIDFLRLLFLTLTFGEFCGERLLARENPSYLKSLSIVSKLPSESKWLPQRSSL